MKVTRRQAEKNRERVLVRSASIFSPAGLACHSCGDLLTDAERFLDQVSRD